MPADGASRTRRISHDQYFKSLITQYPRQALALFDPARFASLDDSVIITPLRQELPPDRLGERFFELDIPLEVRWPDGSRETMVILIEHQTRPQPVSHQEAAEVLREPVGGSAYRHHHADRHLPA